MRQPEIDPNKIIVDLVTQNLAKLLSSGKAAITTHLARIRVGLQLGFSNYLTITRERASTIKTLLYRDRPVEIADRVKERKEHLRSIFASG